MTPPISRNPVLQKPASDGYALAFAAKARPENADCVILNIGPQHPSTHGVLRVMAEVDGERIVRLEPVLGYAHRMHEKMAEVKTWAQFYPNPSRVDYLHSMAWSHAWCGAVEKLAGIEVPERAEFIRVILGELNRLSSHLLWWGAFLLDLGAFTPIMYGFEDRERILDLLQRVTGSRLTYACMRFGGVTCDLDPVFLAETKAVVNILVSRLPMFTTLVTDNVILRKRLEGVGVIDRSMAARYGATGPVARGSAVGCDLRKTDPYSVYDRFDFTPATRATGDCMDRYLVRIEEMRQSCAIVLQAVEQLPDGEFIHPKAPKVKWKAPAGNASYAVEGARGRITFHVFSDGGPMPYRVKLRSPSYSNLSLLAELCEGMLLADFVAVMGSLDLVIPEIDR